MEIFDHWWEYFRVLYWSLSPPTVEHFNKEPVSYDSLEKEYKQGIEKIEKAGKDNIKFVIDLMDKGVSSEEDRRTTIETKAHSMISQTGLAVTLLAATLSLVSLSIDDLGPKIILLFLLCFAAINLIAAGLHARHAVSLKYFYPRQDFTSYLAIENPTVEYILSQVFIVRRLSELNDVKATFLKYSHWFYKATFATLLLLTLSAPLLLLSKAPMNKNIPKVVNINWGVSRESNVNGHSSYEDDTTRHKPSVTNQNSNKIKKNEATIKH